MTTPLADAVPTVAAPDNLPRRGRLLPLLPAAIVVLGAVLRLVRLNDAEYRGDDDDMVMAAYAALQHGWFQAHGLISSIPVDNGPVAMWLLMLPLAISSSLLVAHVWVALLNVAAVALCYHVVRTTWDRRLALVATLLYAVSPWAVMYSRRLWITAFDAPLALVAFWMLLCWLRAVAPAADGATAGDRPGRRRPLTPSPTAQSEDGERGTVLTFPGAYTPRRTPDWRRDLLLPVLCGLAFSAFFQAHVVPIGEVVTLLLVLLAFHRLFGARRIGACLLTLAVSMAPYLLTVVLPALGKTVSGQQARHPTIDGLSWYYFGHLVTGRGYQSIASQSSRLLDATSAPFTAVDWLAVALLAAGVLATAPALLRAWRAQQWYTAARATILLLWALVPPLGLMPHLVDVHPYYFVLSMPAVSILEAAGVLAAARLIGAATGRPATALHQMPAGAVSVEGMPEANEGASRQAGTSAVAALTGVLAAAQLALAVPFFAVLPEYWSANDYGLPLQATERVAATAADLGAGTLAVVGGFDHDVNYTLYSTLGRRFGGARYADDRGILEYAYAGPPLLYLTTDDRSWEASVLQEQFTASRLQTITLPGQGATFRYFRPSVADLRAWVNRVAPPLARPWQWEELARLGGAAVEPALPGQVAHVWLNWRLLQEPPEPLLTRLELTGGDGYIWASVDAVSYPAGYWHGGDAGRLAFLNRLDLALPAYLPPGRYEVRVRLLGIADGRQFGAPGPAGTLTIDGIPPVPADASSELPHAAALPVTPGLTLAGWQVDRQQVQQHDTLGVVLFWRVNGQVAILPSLQLRTADGAEVVTADTSELAGAVPPEHWPAGALLADRHLIRVDGRAQPGAATLTLVRTGSEAVPLGPVTVTPLPRTLQLPPSPHATDATFGGVIRLAGFGVDPAQPAAGSPLRVTLSWQATGLPAEDETVFVHVVDAAGRLVAQGDAPPGGTAAPTSTWEVGQVVADTHTVALPASLAPGAYHLVVGLYNLSTGLRLSVHGPGLPAGSDQVDLGIVQVAAGR